jgi:hypothetical protein
MSRWMRRFYRWLNRYRGCISNTSRMNIGCSTTYNCLHNFQICNKSEGKVVPVFNYASRQEGVLGEWRYRSMHSLTSALYGGELSTSRLGRFIPRERAPGIHWIGGWVGPRAGLDAASKRKVQSTHRNLS